MEAGAVIRECSIAVDFVPDSPLLFRVPGSRLHRARFLAGPVQRASPVSGPRPARQPVGGKELPMSARLWLLGSGLAIACVVAPAVTGGPAVSAAPASPLAQGTSTLDDQTEL